MSFKNKDKNIFLIQFLSQTHWLLSLRIKIKNFTKKIMQRNGMKSFSVKVGEEVSVPYFVQ